MADVDLRTVGELQGDKTAQISKRFARLRVNLKQSAVKWIYEIQSVL